MKAFRTLADGRQIDIDGFANDSTAALAALNSAFDEALLDGLWFAHARQAMSLMAQGSMLSATSGSRGVNATDLGETLINAADLVDQCVTSGPPIPDDLRTRAEQALLEVDIARDALVAYIKGRLDANEPSH